MADLAYIYGRRSHVRGGPSVPQQLEAGTARCATEGWEHAGTYSDTRSASRYENRPRGDWQRLQADLSHHPGRQRLVWLWESSRGDRRLAMWAAFLDRCRDEQIIIYVEAHERAYRVWLPRDWKTLAEDGVANAHYSDQLGQVVRRGLAGAAREGRPHAPVRFGYQRRYDPQTRDLVSQDIVTGEAEIVREIVRSAGAAVPLSVIQRTLEARGIPAPGGGRWHRSTIREIALARAYVGDRTGKRTHLGEEYDAIWPAIITPLEHARAVAVLTDPLRKTTRPGAQRYLLSYLAACGKCGGQLQGQPPGKHEPRYTYRCLSKCTGCGMAPLDAYVRAVITRLFGGLGGHLAADEEGARIALAEAERLQAVIDDHAAESVSARSLKLLEDRLLPQIHAAERKAAALSRPPLPFDPREGWDSAQVWERKEVVRRILDRFDGKIELLPATQSGRMKGGVTLDESRVRISGTRDGVTVVIGPG